MKKFKPRAEIGSKFARHPTLAPAYFALQRQYEKTTFLIDGYEVDYLTIKKSQMKNAIYLISVNGKPPLAAWMNEKPVLHEEARLFMRKKIIPLFSKANVKKALGNRKKLNAQEKAFYGASINMYSDEWLSAGALLLHLEKNCKSIEIVSFDLASLGERHAFVA